MMMGIPLFLYLLIFMVSSDVTSQAIPPQTYPVYQQNGYQNVQPNEYQPYYKDYTVQNQIPPLVNPKTSIKQILMNELLSSPSVQAILGSINNNYSPNSIDMPYNQLPQPNNYCFTPTDIANTDITNAIKNSDTKQKTKSKKKKKRKRKNSNKDNNEETIKDQLNGKEQYSGSLNNRVNSNNFIKTSKKQNNIATEVNSNSRNIPNRDENTTHKPKKLKNLEEINENSTTRNKISKSKKKRKKQNTNQTITDEIIQENKLLNLPTEQINVNELNEGDINGENRFARNLAPDANMLKAWPNLPEDYIKNLFPTINNPFYNPVLDKFFENYYQTLINNNVTNKPIRRNKPKKRKQPKEVRKHVANKSEPPKLVTKLIVIEDNLEPTEKQDNTNIFSNQSKPTVTDLKNDIKPIEIKDKTCKENDKIEYNTTFNEMPKEKQVKTNDFNTDYNYYGFIDDYYPTFNDNAAYNADHTEYYIKNDNNYYYSHPHHTHINYNDNPKEPVGQISSTNKISNYEHFRQIETEYTTTENTLYVKNKPKTEEERLAQEIIKEIERRKEIENIKEIEDKITFQTPPFLTSPNFITRQIDKSEIKYEYHPEIRYVGEKADISTNDKENLIENPARNRHDIETTFARSKVVKYGPSYSDEDSYSGVLNNLWHDFDDDGAVYVMAKSLDSPDIIW